MIRTIIWFIYFWLYLLFSLPILFKVKGLDKQGKISERDLLVHKTAANWARSLVKLNGSTVLITGEENIPKEGAVVFISNHQGNFDIPLLLGYINRPKAFIAKIEILKLPVIRDWMAYMKCVFMDRDDIRQSLRTINKAVEFLHEGYSMVIFPEGTRSKSDTIGDFKPGSFKLPQKAGVPIIPISIKGSYKMMEAQKFIMKPATVEITIHKAIATEGMSKEEANELPDLVKKIIAEKV